MATYEFLKTTKGSNDQTEDWWRLLVDDTTGQRAVQHAWNHARGDHYAKVDKGATTLGLDDFRASDAPQQAKDALAAKLAEIG